MTDELNSTLHFYLLSYTLLCCLSSNVCVSVTLCVCVSVCVCVLVDLLGLLKWRSNTSLLQQNLRQLMKVEGGEVVKVSPPPTPPPRGLVLLLL